MSRFAPIQGHEKWTEVQLPIPNVYARWPTPTHARGACRAFLGLKLDGSKEQWIVRYLFEDPLDALDWVLRHR